MFFDIICSCYIEAILIQPFFFPLAKNQPNKKNPPQDIFCLYTVSKNTQEKKSVMSLCPLQIPFFSRHLSVTPLVLGEFLSGKVLISHLGME